MINAKKEYLERKNINKNNLIEEKKSNLFIFHNHLKGWLKALLNLICKNNWFFTKVKKHSLN